MLLLSAGFSVAFGSTKSRGSAGGLVLFVLQVQGGGGGGVVPGSMFPQEISKIQFSKMQFPAFAGLELDDQESLLRPK